jgi:hypothetical protein
MRDYIIKRCRPLVPLVIGVGLLYGAYKAYPFSAELPAPPNAVVAIQSKVPISQVDYSVAPNPKEPFLTAVAMTIHLSSAPAHRRNVYLQFQPAFNVNFAQCPPPRCKKVTSSPHYEYWGKQLTFTSKRTATTHFFLIAYHFGVSTDDTVAKVAFPQVTYQGPGKPVLVIGYRLRSLADYDWSLLPPLRFFGPTAIWEEALAHGLTVNKDAIGNNHINQTIDDLLLFLSGALVGLGGAAVLTFIQELLHFND